MIYDAYGFHMGCLTSKEETAHQEVLPQRKTKYTEYVDDIDCIRRAAKNVCLLYAGGWKIDGIKNTWDMSVKMWSPFESSTDSVKNGKEYLNVRFSQAIELLEIQEGLKFPKVKEDEIDMTHVEEEDQKYHKFRLAFVIGLEDEASCASILFVAAEQKGTQCKLISGHGLIDINGFRRSIGLPSSDRRWVNEEPTEWSSNDESEEFL